MSLKSVWYGMRKRCYNDYPKGYGYNAWYRDKGIIICDEWLNDFSAFEKWALENGYQKGLTIDRIDRDGNYEPSNCRWVTPRENSKHANEKKKKKGRSGNGGRYCLVEQYYGWNKYRVVEIGLSLSEVLKKIDEMNILARKEQRIHWCYGEVHYNKMKTQKHFKEGMWLGGITNQNGVRGYTQKSNCDC